MGVNLGLKPSIIRHHYRRLNAGTSLITCKKQSDCLQPIILELQDEKKEG
jgi:hypothetical protein